MGLLEDIFADLGRAPNTDGPMADDHPIIRLSNALLLRIGPENATHLRVVSGPEPRMDFRSNGVWGNGPSPYGSSPGSRSRLCAKVISRLAEMGAADTRAPFAFGNMYLVLDPPEKDPPRRMLELNMFHAHIEGGSAIVVMPVTGTTLMETETEQALRDEITDLVRKGHQLRMAGKCAESKSTLERALAMAAPEPSTSPMYKAEILDALARAHEALGDLDAATAEWLRAIAVAEAGSCPDNPLSVFSRTELARLELDRNDTNAAQVHVDHARRIMRALFGEQCSYMEPDFQHARMERLRGEPGARRSLEEVRALSAKWKDVVTEACAAYELGLEASEHGDLPRAAACMRDALTKLVVPQPFTADIELALARVLRAQGRDPEALSLVQHANEILSAHRGPEHPERVKAEIELARFEKPGRPYR